MRRNGWCAMVAASVLAAGSLAAPTHAGPATAAKVTCPLDASGAASGKVQWAFSQLGAPSGRHPGVTKSYTHGHGTWSGGRARGWVCHQDQGGGDPKRHVVLRATKVSSAVRGHVMRLGKLGVEVVLPLIVTATDDDSCAVGTHATMTLFASYYDVHVDRGALRFAPGCRKHDHTWRDPQLKVLIQHPGGVQVD